MYYRGINLYIDGSGSLVLLKPMNYDVMIQSILQIKGIDYLSSGWQLFINKNNECKIDTKRKIIVVNTIKYLYTRYNVLASKELNND